MTDGRPVARDLTHMSEHLPIWGQRWGPTKASFCSSTGEEGELRTDGTYASSPLSVITKLSPPSLGSALPSPLSAQKPVDNPRPGEILRLSPPTPPASPPSILSPLEQEINYDTHSLTPGDVPSSQSPWKQHHFLRRNVFSDMRGDTSSSPSTNSELPTPPDIFQFPEIPYDLPFDSNTQQQSGQTFSSNFIYGGDSFNDMIQYPSQSATPLDDQLYLFNYGLSQSECALFAKPNAYEFAPHYPAQPEPYLTGPDMYQPNATDDLQLSFFSTQADDQIGYQPLEQLVELDNIGSPFDGESYNQHTTPTFGLEVADTQHQSTDALDNSMAKLYLAPTKPDQPYLQAAGTIESAPLSAQESPMPKFTLSPTELEEFDGRYQPSHSIPHHPNLRAGGHRSSSTSSRQKRNVIRRQGPMGHSQSMPRQIHRSMSANRMSTPHIDPGFSTHDMLHPILPHSASRVSFSSGFGELSEEIPIDAGHPWSTSDEDMLTILPSFSPNARNNSLWAEPSNPPQQLNHLSFNNHNHRINQNHGWSGSLSYPHFTALSTGTDPPSAVQGRNTSTYSSSPYSSLQPMLNALQQESMLAHGTQQSTDSNGWHPGGMFFISS